MLKPQMNSHCCISAAFAVCMLFAQQECKAQSYREQAILEDSPFHDDFREKDPRSADATLADVLWYRHYNTAGEFTDALGGWLIRHHIKLWTSPQYRLEIALTLMGTRIPDPQGAGLLDPNQIIKAALSRDPELFRFQMQLADALEQGGVIMDAPEETAPETRDRGLDIDFDGGTDVAGGDDPSDYSDIASLPEVRPEY